jgi:hypothetical protein
MPHVPCRHLPRQRRQLMHDHLGLRRRHRLCDRVRVERVGDDRNRAQTAYQIPLRGTPGHPDHLVALGHELRHQRPSEHARGTGDENLHDRSTGLIALLDEMAAPAVTVPMRDSLNTAQAQHRLALSSRDHDTQGRQRRPSRPKWADHAASPLSIPAGPQPPAVPHAALSVQWPCPRRGTGQWTVPTAATLAERLRFAM